MLGFGFLCRCLIRVLLVEYQEHACEHEHAWMYKCYDAVR